MNTIKKNEFYPDKVHHPGEDLREKLEELKMGPKEFALKADKPEKTITAILNGTSSITPEMAVQFENVLKIPARFWLNRQRSYDEFIARVKREEILKDAYDWAKLFPVSKMIELEWLPSAAAKENKAAELLSFFSVSSPNAWENYYLKGKLKVGFRISLAGTKEPYAISAWLRQGEILASQMESIPYNEKALWALLPEIKQLMVDFEDNFFQKLQEMCLGAGVKVVYTPCLPKAPIYGATRWLNNIPLIQISGRLNRNDIFWFTFFHEIGHILLHGKKEIFLEKIEYAGESKEKEMEADNFSSDVVLSKKEENEILNKEKITVTDIYDFAEKFNTLPAIIIGRLQHMGAIPYSAGHEFIKPVTLN